MADLNVSVADVKGACSGVTQSDDMIQLVIDTVSCSADSCLEASYVDCMDRARLIKLYAICHILTVSGRAGQVKSRKYANGASESYSNYVDGGRGLNGSQFGESVLMLDSSGCIAKAFPSTARQFITTAGTAGSQATGFRR